MVNKALAFSMDNETACEERYAVIITICFILKQNSDRKISLMSIKLVKPQAQ